MKLTREFFLYCSRWGVLATALIIYSCESNKQSDPQPNDPDHPTVFPSFITSTESYFDLRIGQIPNINGVSYQLEISGAVNNPANFTLEELKNQEMVERTLTIECIGNQVNGSLLGNVTWKGFRLYNLLEDLGIKEGASTVKYICEDGYYTYNTIEELQNAGVIGAMYMNDSLIPAKYGFPLRIIFPGYYGVRHPGWIVKIEVLESMEEDYWSRSGWKTDTAMAIDSKIFFPYDNAKFSPGDSIKIGGAAFGGRRITAVDITLDEGNTWIPATITEELDEDYVWVFWEVVITTQSAGTLILSSRATAQDGSVQPQDDDDFSDGTNSWPSVTISVTEND